MEPQKEKTIAACVVMTVSLALSSFTSYLRLKEYKEYVERLANVRGYGDIRDLAADEYRHFSEELNGEYDIGSQLGKSGSSSSTFLIKNKKTQEICVLKIPNISNEEGWLKRRIDGYEKLKRTGYSGNVTYPRLKKVYGDCIVETYIGEKMTDCQKLSDDVKDKMAEDLAGFLVYIHEKLPARKTIDLTFIDSAVEAIDMDFKYIERYFSNKEKTEFFEGLEKLKARDKSDEVIVLSHGDLRSSNLLIEGLGSEQPRIGICDFESMSMQNIYTDFIPPKVVSANLDFKFWSKVIDSYNNKAKHKVDKEKIKLVLEICIWGEGIEKTKNRNFSTMQPDIHVETKEMIDNLERYFV